MAQTIINVKCIDQDLEITSKPLIASGGSNEDVVQWEFSEHWDGFEKTAVFYRAGDDHYHIPVDTDNKSVIPHEVTANLGQFIFGVFGVLGDVIRTSEVVSYDVQKGALYSQCNIQNTSPNIYTEILRRISALEEGQDPEQIQKIVDEALKEAEESGAFDGPPGADGKSAYEVAVANGFEGTEEEWLASLKGEDGEQGPIGETGADGYSPVKGTDYYTDEDKQEIITDMLKQVPQPDWNQNDPTQPDYVKNRTHYTEVVEVPETEILPETTLQYNDDVGGFMLTESLNIESGKEYVVSWNGTAYEVLASSMVVGEGILAVVVGNIGAMTGGIDTGEPFVIMVAPADIAAQMGIGTQIMAIDGSTELTISMKTKAGRTETIHKLDNKYLDLAWIPEINIVENEAISETTVTLSGYMPLTNVPIDAFAVGTKLLVVWDGVRYEYTVEAISDGSETSLFFGSKTGSPFAFLGVLGYPYYILQAPEGEHTYTIKTLDEVYNVIPDGFLGSSKNVVDLNELGMSTVGDATAGNDIVLNIDTFDYVSALLAGRTLKFKFKVNLRNASNSFRPVDIIAILDETSAEGLIPNARSYRFSTASITNLGIHVITLDISDGQINASVRRIADTETTTVETTE